MPFRAQAGKPLPLFLIIKDADKFPILPERLVLRYGPTPSVEKQLEIPLNRKEVLSKAFFTETFRLPAHLIDRPGRWYFRPVLFWKKESATPQQQTVVDSYPDKAPGLLIVNFYKENLPKFPGWLLGDLHTHSNYTSDQIEFGAPLAQMQEAARTVGLDFFAVTDHSYDLDDAEDDYLKNDPALPKWKRFWEETERLNRSNPKGPTIIPGEEVSCGNYRNNNFHLLILNDRRFHPGAGDGAEKLFANRPTQSLPEVLQAASPNALAVAAHPGEQPPFSQRFLLNRGDWHTHDCLHPRLNALQILNNNSPKALKRGLSLWKAALLAGRRIGIMAGSDAHGNFNIYRQVEIPLISMLRHRDHLFGLYRTAVYSESNQPDDIVENLRRLHAVISNGPLLIFSHPDYPVAVGETLPRQALAALKIEGISSGEFGTFKSVRLFWGSYRRQEEVEVPCPVPPNSYRLEIPLPEIPPIANYLRARAETANGEIEYFSLTNPIWIANE
ncbi:MAG: hypothetical protein Kow0037_25210 [Calditrichia bacterium]